MTNKTHLVAIHKIGAGDPDKRVFTATGEYNPDGTPKMKKDQPTIKPGEFFPVAWFKEYPAEVDRLISLGAARWLNETELAVLAQMQSRKGV